MKLKKIVEVLSQLQEGYLEELSIEGSTLNLKVECKHIAGVLDPSYAYFYIVIKGVKDYFFLPWDDEEMKITSLKEIQLFKLDILNVEKFDDHYLKIYSNCENVYSGGCLYLNASDIIVYDENFNVISPNTLEELSDHFWISSDKI